MTLYLIDVKSLVDMNDHIRWQTSKETGHISQCSLENPVASVFAGYSRLKRRLLLSDKTTENDSLFLCKTLSSVA